MNLTFFRPFGCLFLVFATNLAAAADDLRTQMGAETFAEAGLNKLTETELAKLEGWLRTRGEAAELQSQAKALPATPGPVRSFFDRDERQTIESEIVGEYAGYAPQRRFTLANGQVWIQTDSDTVRMKLVNPKVRIRPKASTSWLMNIVGENRVVRVRPVLDN